MYNIAFFSASTITTLVLLYILTPYATKIGLTDKPGGRKHHEFETPLTGGIAICLSLFLICNLFSITPFQGAGYLAVAIALLLVTGIIDDLRDLPARYRLAVQMVAGLLMIKGAGLSIGSLGNLLFVGDLTLGLACIPFTLFAVSAGINAVNFTDGIDGLAGGLTMISLAMLSFVAYQSNLTVELVFLMTLMGGLAGFLLLNFRFPWNSRARLFLGDSGSTVMGFVLVSLFVYFTQHTDANLSPVTILWIFGVQLIDAGAVILKRALRRASPLAPDRGHLHHFLLELGMDPRLTTMTIYALSIGLGAVGLAVNYSPLSDGWLFIGFIGMLAAYTLFSLRMEQIRTLIHSLISPRWQGTNTTTPVLPCPNGVEPAHDAH